MKERKIERVKQLASFQRIGRDFLTNHKTALLADEMRMGKSCQAIRAADKIKARKLLIVCPASVKITWVREFDKWSTMRRTYQIVSGVNAKINYDADVIIINYDIIWRPHIKQQLIATYFGAGIFDESHYLGGRESNRTIACLDSTDRTPIISRCVYKWFLSGTPILNRPRELYPVLASCAPHVIDPYLSYEAYTAQFCGAYWDGVQWVDSGSTNREDLNRRLHNNFMLRRLRKDHLDEIPRDVQLLPVDTTGKVKDLIAQEFSWHKDDAKKQKLELNGEAVATVRKELALAKVKPAVSHIHYVLTLEDKLVVFAYTREVIHELTEKLKKYNPVVVMGGMSGDNKQLSVDSFTNDPTCRVFIGQLTAAGTGIDLSVANNMLVIEPDWSPGALLQPMDRCSGWNQDKKVFIQIMVFADSLEEHMLKTAIEKKNNTTETIEDLDIFK